MKSESTVLSLPGLIKRGGGLLTALLLLATTLFSFTSVSPAAAAEGSQVKIDDIAIEYGGEVGVIEDWSYQRIDVKWSIPGDAVTPVLLTIDLPEGFYGKDETFPVNGPDDSQAGVCDVTTTNITCGIDDAFIKENPKEVSGDFYFEARTQLDNRVNVDKPINIGGFENEVVVTPSSNWCTENCEFGQFWDGKWGSYNTATDEIIFTVQVKGGNTGIAAGKTVNVTDLLDNNSYELVVDDEYPRVREARLLQYNRWGKEVVGGWQTYPTSDVTWSKSNLTATFKSSKGRGSEWNNHHQIIPPAQGSQRGTDGSFYQVQWKVKALTGGELQGNGNRVFRNAAKWDINGEESGEVKGSATRYSRGGNVVGTNYGKIQITKELTGDTTLNPKFTVNYTVTEGETTLEGSIEVSSGETYTSPEFFRGAVVELTEVQPAGPANVNWADPVFLDADGNPADTLTFTADGNGKMGEVTEIRLLNEATLQKGDFSAQKNVENENEVPLVDDLEFSLDYSYPADAEKGFPTGSGTLRLPISGETVTSEALPVGAVLTLAEPNLPNVPGATWDEPVIDPSTLTIGDSDDPVAVSVTNTIAQDVGGFSITKAVIGDGTELVPEDAQFTVTYEYDAINEFPAGSGQIEFGAGETETVNSIPAGATVTLTELSLEDPTGGTWDEPEFSESSFTIVKDTVVSIDLDNPISWNSGDFSVLKAVTGDGVDLVGEDTLFTVDYSYTLPDGLGADRATGVGSLTVANDGQAIFSDSLPYDTEVTLSEATPTEVAGGTWLGYEFDNPIFTIGDQTTFEVVLTNEIERDLGGFAVTKAVEGSGADLIGEGTEFTVNYSHPAGDWYEAGEGTLTVTKSNTATVDGLPEGAVVTLEEVLPADPENGTWVSASFPDGNIVTVGKNQTAEVALVNEIALGEGGFNIQKLIEGSGKNLVADGAAFVVHYEYDAGVGFEAGEGTLEMTSDGSATTVDGLPAGAEVQLTEQTPSSVEGATWTGHEFSTDTITVGKSEVAEITLTNTIEKDEVIATTGGSVPGLLIAGALALLLVGAATILFTARRQRS